MKVRVLSPPAVKVLVVVLARLGSTRFPGKVVGSLEGKPVIVHLLSRLKRDLDASVVKLVLATSDDPANDELEGLAKGVGVDVVRGPESDVLARFARCLDHFDADIIVRLNADNPLICPNLIQNVYEALLANSSADYASTILKETFPLGMHVEAMRSSVCRVANRYAESALDREHVTPFIYNSPDLFRLLSVESEDAAMARIRVTVDYEIDLRVINDILTRLDGERVTLAAVLRVLEEAPSLLKNTMHTKPQAIWHDQSKYE